MEAAQISRILGGRKVLHMRVNERQDLIALSKHGVTKIALLNLAKYLCFTLNEISELLPISEHTVQRYALGKHFNPSISEQILQIAEVAARGVEVFESRDNFLEWMKQPNVALGKKTPISLLSSRFGARMILDEIGRLEHGVVS